MNDVFLTVIATREGMREKFLTGWTHCESMLMNGEQVELRVGPALDTIGAKQRGFLHAGVLPQIAEQVFVGEKRERFVADIWKEHFHRRFIPDRWVMRKLPGAKKATPHRERVSSESLGPKRYSEWIDRIIDTCVMEHGVVFEFRDGEREAVRYVAKPKQGRTH